MGPRRSFVTWIVLALISWALILFPIAGCVSNDIEATVCDDTVKPDCAPARTVGIET